MKKLSLVLIVSLIFLSISSAFAYQKEKKSVKSDNAGQAVGTEQTEETTKAADTAKTEKAAKPEKIHKYPKNYIYSNYRYDFIKLEKLSGKDYKGITANHPYQFTDDQMKGILASLKLDKKVLFKSELKTRDVFDDKGVSFLAPYLVKAFGVATPDQRIVLSYITKDPFFIIRNDRLTLASLWMENDGLHIRFHKLFAKMLGDTDKLGYEARKMDHATGTRTSIDAGEGQQLVSGDELLIDTSFNFALVRPIEEEVKSPRVVVTTKDKKGDAKVESEKLTQDRAKSVKARLTELDALQKDKLITKEEYEQKKKELLNQL